MEILSKNADTTKKLLTALINDIPKTRTCDCEKALLDAAF